MSKSIKEQFEEKFKGENADCEIVCFIEGPVFLIKKKDKCYFWGSIWNKENPLVVASIEKENRAIDRFIDLADDIKNAK